MFLLKKNKFMQHRRSEDREAPGFRQHCNEKSVVDCRCPVQPTECRHSRPIPGPTVNLRRSAATQPSLQAYLDRFRSLFSRRDYAVYSAVPAPQGCCPMKDSSRSSRRLCDDMNQVRRPLYFAADSAWSDLLFPAVAGRGCTWWVWRSHTAAGWVSQVVND